MADTTLPVTQAIREAAADVVKAYRDQKNDNWQARIRRGECDDGEMVQAFARYGATYTDTIEKLAGALEEARRAIGDHFAPNDCYATGPITGNAYRDLIECPACSFIAKYDAALALVRKETGNG